jgi:hypothetical protein
VKHLLWASTAAYFVWRRASGDEWPALIWAAIFGYVRKTEGGAE